MFKGIRRQEPEAAQPGSALSLKTALGFAAMVAAVLFASAALNAWLGRAGVIVASAVAGSRYPFHCRFRGVAGSGRKNKRAGRRHPPALPG
jgi:hypothetical protein